MPSIEIIQTAVTAALLLSFLLTSKLVNKFIGRYAQEHSYSPNRVVATKKSVSFFVFIVFAFLVSLTWGVNLREIYIISTSILAVVGVAFFAVWSMLSNITAGIILFFRYPFKVGDMISFLDMRDCQARVVDITAFHMLLEEDNGNRITVPNNLAIQKGIVIIKESNLAAPAPEEKPDPVM
ncbi:MAG: mechanosensitive ion channel family protein [Planctomycetes bacterium]|nr:mechanosensitive ion channel family protein [Planctomycetota bacterium]